VEQMIYVLMVHAAGQHIIGRVAVELEAVGVRVIIQVLAVQQYIRQPEFTDLMLHAIQ
jgi:hypothetical protein